MDREISFYAFGIVANLYNTRLIPLDFDSVTYEYVTNMADHLMQEKDVESIDIVSSSHGPHWHMIITLNEFKNIRHFLPFIPRVCAGYVNCSTQMREAVLRVSKKFYREDVALQQPTYAKALRKNKDTIICYTRFNFPETRVISTEIKKKSINLRG